MSRVVTFHEVIFHEKNHNAVIIFLMAAVDCIPLLLLEEKPFFAGIHNDIFAQVLQENFTLVSYVSEVKKRRRPFSTKSTSMRF